MCVYVYVYMFVGLCIYIFLYIIQAYCISHLHLLFGCILSTLNKDVMMMMMRSHMLKEHALALVINVGCRVTMSARPVCR